MSICQYVNMSICQYVNMSVRWCVNVSICQCEYVNTLVLNNNTPAGIRAKQCRLGIWRQNQSKEITCPCNQTLNRGVIRLQTKQTSKQKNKNNKRTNHVFQTWLNGAIVFDTQNRQWLVTYECIQMNTRNRMWRPKQTRRTCRNPGWCIPQRQ